MDSVQVNVEVEAMHSSNDRVKGRANVMLSLGQFGTVQVLGLVVVESAEGGLRVVLPVRRGKRDGQFFDVVRLFGRVHEEVREAVLAAYRERVGKGRPTS